MEKTYLVLLVGKGEGCDYTIGCNKTWDRIICDPEQLKNRVKDFVMQYHSGYEQKIEKVEVLEVVNCINYSNIINRRSGIFYFSSTGFRHGNNFTFSRCVNFICCRRKDVEVRRCWCGRPRRYSIFMDVRII